MRQFHIALLTDLMPAARQALSSRFEWYSHVTWRSNELAIRQGGLECRSPQNARAPKAIVDVLGEKAHEIACLHPFGARLPLFPDRGINPLRLAIHRDDLPSQIGFDWSHDSVFPLADVLHEENPQQDPVEIFVEVVDRRGSVACYEPIAVAALRYHVDGLRIDDPSEWPTLTA